ncbi:MAG: acyltransferase [Desulfitobacteriaceae bacterium]
MPKFIASIISKIIRNYFHDYLSSPEFQSYQCLIMNIYSLLNTDKTRIDIDYLSTEFENNVKKIIMNKYLVWGDEKGRLNIANTAVVNNALFNLSSGNISIEDWVFFGHNVSVLTGTHNYYSFDEKRQADYPCSGRDVIIKRGAWVASNSTIAGPCIIGEHSVVAACSFVNGDVPSYSIVAGIPAKVIKQITF